MSSGLPLPSGRLVFALSCALTGAFAPAAAAAGFRRDRTPLPTDVSGTGGAHVATHVASGTGSAALHMLLGLAVVLALIFGLYKLLRRSAAKNDKTVRDDGFIGVVSSTPLAPSRSLHLVRVGEELVLVGSSEQTVTPIRVYSRDEARRLGVDPELAAPALPFSPAPAGRPGFGAALVESLKRMTAR